MSTSTASQPGRAGTSNGKAPRPVFTWDRWVASLGVPLYNGYYVEDLKTVKLGRWEERGCDAAFIQLVGQEGITETRVTEIPPQGSLPPVQIAFDEIVYVLRGRGATIVSRPGTSHRTSFEWQANSMFLLPRHHAHQFTNTHRSEPVRLVHYNYLPLAMSAVPDPAYFFTTDVSQRGLAAHVELQTFYQEAKLRRVEQEGMLWGNRKEAWVGSFFPDMSLWDKLETNASRGAGGHSVFIEFPGSELSCHMSVFRTRTYKKAHRHGPGRAIVIPAGEGYTVMWEEGKEKVVAPWHPGSLITPPNKWFHQHFNVGRTPARYLAFHPPMQFYGYAEEIEDRVKDQIEYVDEAPEVREKFEAELAKRELTSAIPDEVYKQRDFVWSAKTVQED